MLHHLIVRTLNCSLLFGHLWIERVGVKIGEHSASSLLSDSLFLLRSFWGPRVETEQVRVGKGEAQNYVFLKFLIFEEMLRTESGPCICWVRAPPVFYSSTPSFFCYMMDNLLSLFCILLGVFSWIFPCSGLWVH